MKDLTRPAAFASALSAFSALGPWSVATRVEEPPTSEPTRTEVTILGANMPDGWVLAALLLTAAALLLIAPTRRIHRTNLLGYSIVLLLGGFVLGGIALARGGLAVFGLFSFEVFARWEDPRPAWGLITTALSSMLALVLVGIHLVVARHRISTPPPTGADTATAREDPSPMDR